MKQIKTSIRNIKISKLTINPFLSKYGIHKLSAFEIQELNRFDIPVGQVLATQDNSVLFNWDAVEEANKRGMKEIAITVIEGIDAEESIQVISLKNMRRKLSRYQQAELIVELRDYLDNNPVAKPWKVDIPGDSVLKKVAFLVGYSYGMTTQLQRIYKHRPELLQGIDEGEMTFVQALQLVTDSSRPNESDVNTGDDEPVVNDVEVDTDPDQDDTGTEPPIDVQHDNDQIGSKYFAGERNMVPCENIAGIRIVYASGKVIEFNISDGKANGAIAGEPAKEMHYNGQFHPTDNTEFHVLSTDRDRTSFQVIISNADKIAA